MIKIFDLTFYFDEKGKRVEVELNREKTVTDELIIESLNEFLIHLKNENKENKNESNIDEH